ncbi:MAG: sugar nucleotide-binding protein [Nanoarchaeota archaeon]
MDISKVLIIGKDSAIAQEIQFGIKLSHKDLDITKIEDVKKALLKYNPSAVLCLASVDLNNSEKNPSLAYEVNVLGLCNVATEALELNIPIIIISSGAIFNGKAGEHFDENHLPNPLNIYGKTKYLAELILQRITKNFLIIRTGWLFGLSYKKSGFSKFIDYLINSESLSGIKATDDSTGSPTYIVDFIDELKKLIQSNSKGIFHIANSNCGSAYDVVKEVASIKNKKNLVEVVNTNFTASVGIPARSESECLISNKIKLRPWQGALKDYYLKIKNH